MTNSSSSSCLSKSSKIYVAGHHGLVGSAIWNNLKARGYHNLVGRSHSELDLTDQYAVQKFFDLLHACYSHLSVQMLLFWPQPLWVVLLLIACIVPTSSCKT